MVRPIVRPASNPSPGYPMMMSVGLGKHYRRKVRGLKTTINAQYIWRFSQCHPVNTLRFVYKKLILRGKNIAFRSENNTNSTHAVFYRAMRRDLIDTCNSNTLDCCIVARLSILRSANYAVSILDYYVERQENKWTLQLRMIRKKCRWPI
jgi:hypothetical protein